MASMLHSSSSCSAYSIKLMVGFHRATTGKGNNTIISFNAHHVDHAFTKSTLRLKKCAILPKQRIVRALASNNKSSKEFASNNNKSSKGSRVTKSSDNNEANSKRPFLLTILDAFFSAFKLLGSSILLLLATFICVYFHIILFTPIELGNDPHMFFYFLAVLSSTMFL